MKSGVALVRTARAVKNCGGCDGAVSKMFLFLLTLIAGAGAGWHFYAKGGGTPKTVLADAREWLEKVRSGQAVLPEDPDSPEAVAARYAQNFSQRSYTLLEAGQHPDLWPEEVLVKPRLPGMPRPNIEGKLLSVEPQFLEVSVLGKVVRVTPEKTDFDEKLRQNIYTAAYAEKLKDLGADEGYDAVRPMQSRTSYIVPVVESYIRRNVLPTQRVVMGDWTKVKDARYQGKPCYVVHVTVGVANQQGVPQKRFQFYLNGNKVLWTNFEKL